ncbi:MAG: LysM peptidoglycan-binding domain-containing protein [Candidatus Promineifilaceae bacterium]|jgi:LysM repeat protein
MRKLKNLLISIFILFLILVPVVTAGTAYIVKPGDSLSKIASRFGVTVQEIVDANHIEDPNVVVVGMELTIPDGESAAVDNAQEPAATEIPAAQAEVSPAAEAATSITQETDAGSTIPGTYVVAAGDSLSKIAAMFGTVYKVLADLNGIASPYRIYAGQILNIPGQQNVEAPDQAAADTAPSAAAETAVQPVVKPSVTSLSAPIVRETAVSIPTYNY